MSCRSKYRAAAAVVSLLAGCSALAPQERDPTPVSPTAVVEIHTSSTGSRGIPAVETTTLSYTRAAMQRVESHVKGSGIFARLLYTDAQQRIERLDRNLAWVLDAKNKKAIECPLKGCTGAPTARPARQGDDRAPVCRLKITESTVTAHSTGRKRRINGFETDEYAVTWQVTLRDNASRKSLSTMHMQMWNAPLNAQLKDAVALERAFARARGKIAGAQPQADTAELLPPYLGRIMSEHLAASISPTDRANLLASLSRPPELRGQPIRTIVEWRMSGEACAPASALDEPLLRFTAEVKTHHVAELHDSLFLPPRGYEIAK